MTSSAQLKILLIEDDRADYILTRELLRQIQFQSFDLAWVQSLAEAREWIAQNGEPHLYLLDFRIDQEDSLAFLSAQVRGGARAPFLVLTGQREREIDMWALQAGAADYLVKGQVTPDQLWRAIRYALERQSNRHALVRANDELEMKVRERTRELAAANERLVESYRMAQATNRLKDEFLATLSHELRSPLNVISGHAELLLGEDLSSEDARVSLEAIRRNVRHQTQMIDDLLDVSRVITGKLSLRVAQVDLSEILRNTLEAVRFAAEAKGIQFLVEEESEGFRISVDPDRLQQLMWNLLSNAIKFSRPGGLIRMSWLREPDGVEIRVSDDGIGIQPDFLPFIFDRFRQEDSSMSRRHGGLGLGLAIVRHIAELHGGQVNVESGGRDQGATFTVRLPSNRAHLGAQAEGAASETREVAKTGAGVGGLSGCEVLLVDDHADTLRILSRFLQIQGVSVRAAPSVREALRLYDQLRPHVVITDISMPAEDGFVLMRELNARPDPAPCIALTAYAGSQISQEVSEAGFRQHLTKPIFRDQLVSAIKGVLGTF